jgi:NAD(P)-dependent dehydrogenase (short-subunit alcohol dehydrogenase family)
MRFEGQCALVLGGNAGIGLAVARMVRAEGAKVAITGRSPESLRAAAEELDALAIRADLASLADSDRVMAEVEEALGGIDVLFVNAGVGGFAPASEITGDFWDGIHSVNLRGAFFAIQKALPLMRDGGAIVITGSIGAVSAVPGNAAYAAAKAGIRAVARVLAAELLPRRIRVNVVSPGPTDTEIFKRDASAEEIAGLRQFFAGVVPEGRMGTPEEVASAAVFLASREASFINGVDLFVDGGCVELKS